MEKTQHLQWARSREFKVREDRFRQEAAKIKAVDSFNSMGKLDPSTF